MLCNDNVDYYKLEFRVGLNKITHKDVTAYNNKKKQKQKAISQSIVLLNTKDSRLSG